MLSSDRFKKIADSLDKEASLSEDKKDGIVLGLSGAGSLLSGGAAMNRIFGLASELKSYDLVLPKVEQMPPLLRGAKLGTQARFLKNLAVLKRSPGAAGFAAASGLLGLVAAHRLNSLHDRARDRARRLDFAWRAWEKMF